MKKVIYYAALSALTLGWASLSHAQRAIDIERFTPALDVDGFLAIQGSRTPGHLQWNVALWGDYSLKPLENDQLQDLETNWVQERAHSNFIAQVGLGGRFGFALNAPLIWAQRGQSPGPGGDAPRAFAMGDPQLIARFRFFGDETPKYAERNEGTGSAILVAAHLPLGHDDAFAAEPKVRTDVQWLTDFHILGGGIGMMLGWSHRFETQRFFGAAIRDELKLGGAIQIPIPVELDLSALLETRTITDAGNPFAKTATTAVEGELGARLVVHDFAFTTALGAGFTDAYGSPDLRALLGIAWAPRAHDKDGDGVEDATDPCPHLPEDHDGFEDHDGCLDPDNDNDLVPDEEDKCPNVMSVEGQDVDEDGCTDPQPIPPLPPTPDTPTAPTPEPAPHNEPLPVVPLLDPTTYP